MSSRDARDAKLVLEAMRHANGETGYVFGTSEAEIAEMIREERQSSRKAKRRSLGHKVMRRLAKRNRLAAEADFLRHTEAGLTCAINKLRELQDEESEAA